MQVLRRIPLAETCPATPSNCDTKLSDWLDVLRSVWLCRVAAWDEQGRAYFCTYCLRFHFVHSPDALPFYPLREPMSKVW
jgi:hypothetical protein